jgi:Cdc6-like AAA superfamily ATPase
MEPAAIVTTIFKLWQWITLHLKSSRYKTSWQLLAQHNPTPAEACKKFIEAEKEHREQDIASLMELSLAERVERCRAMGPLKFIGTGLDEEGKFIHLFSRNEQTGQQQPVPAKFRTGDFLRLVPLGVTDLQSGIPVIMGDPVAAPGEVALYLRQPGMDLNGALLWSLEEDGEDYLSAKLFDASQRAFSKENQQIQRIFNGTLTDSNSFDKKWLYSWLQTEAAVAHLNVSQQQAMETVFQFSLSLIIGPPGTGKTHLLSWIIIALIRSAQADGTPLRIAVSALTHKAIDQVLRKLVNLVNTFALPDFPARCFKWGTWDGEPAAPDSPKMQVEECQNARDLQAEPYAVCGATGYGLYRMLHNREAKGTPAPFDWVIFDEASQLLLPQALLSLIHGKGKFLFLGDVQQLPPIIRSQVHEEDTIQGEDLFATEIRSSVLEILLKRYPMPSRQLNVTYRMNSDICSFPSQTWYEGLLHPAPAIVDSRLRLSPSHHNDLTAAIIDPSQPVTLVGVHHRGAGQESPVEAELLAKISYRLLRDHGLNAGQLAIITPHRAQNNAVRSRLTGLWGHDNLPVIDTVERMQGAERDVILFGFTCSDPDLVFSDFLNSPNRFNVVLTRARHKLIVVGSMLFFESIARTETQLQANGCFKDFVSFCRHNDWYYEYGTP